MAQPRWKRLGIGGIKLTIAALVLWGVGRHVLRAWEAFGRQDTPIRMEPGWLLLSGGFYLAGLTCCGYFFHQILRSGQSPVGPYSAIRAYLVSHLGKYVPGKAMVVVVRAGMVVPYGAKGVTAAVATFYETLVMMAAGGLIGAMGFGMASARSDSPITIEMLDGWEPAGRFLSKFPLFALCAAVSFALGLAFLIVVLPPVFRRLIWLATTPFGGVGLETYPRISYRLLIWGLLWSSLCWILLGLSQLAVVRSISLLSLYNAAQLLPLVIASVAIATVAGFVVAVLPGGLGVREGVLMVALGPVVGDSVAVASALLLRLIWIVAEVIAGCILTAIRPPPLREPDLPLPTGLHDLASAPTEMGHNLP